MASQTHYRQGLSLVELAISIAIIGLLIVGTISGANMIKTAKLRRVVTELNNFKTSIQEFEEEYYFLPGDLPTATTFWSTECTADFDPSSNCNGNGNGAIEFTGTTAGVPDVATTAGTPQEDLLSWLHLAYSYKFPGDFSGKNISADARYGISKNAPSSEGFKDGLYMLRTEADNAGSNIYDTRGITIRLGTLANISGSAKSWPIGGIMSAKDAYAIDKKSDDGKASAGALYSIRTPQDPVIASGCVETVSGNEVYDLDDSTKTCTLVYWYKKF